MAASWLGEYNEMNQNGEQRPMSTNDLRAQKLEARKAVGAVAEVGPPAAPLPELSRPRGDFKLLASPGVKAKHDHSELN